MNKDKNETWSGEKSQEDSSFQNKIDENIRESGKKFAQAGKSTIAREVGKFGAALHSAASTLYEQNDYFADLTETAAQKVDEVSRYVQSRKPEEVLTAVGEFSKRNPYLVAGGMFVAGLALSRFIRTGSETKEKGGVS